MEKSITKKAIEKSIKHWEKHILKPLLDGKQIYEGARCGKLCWKHSYKVVKCYSNSCELCKLFIKDCAGCPLLMYGYRCHNSDSPWYKFKNNPNITNARKMIKILKSVSEHYS